MHEKGEYIDTFDVEMWSKPEKIELSPRAPSPNVKKAHPHINWCKPTNVKCDVTDVYRVIWA